MAVKPIPDEYHTVTPYLYFDEAARAIEFYKKAFGAQEHGRMDGPNGAVGHAELQIGDSRIMLADNPDSSPRKLGRTSVSFVIYVEDVDAAFSRALDAGATVVQAVEDKFYGDRMGMLSDPFGHEWSIGTHIEDVSMEEMEKRSAEAMAKMS
jgi:PhnB protein